MRFNVYRTRDGFLLSPDSMQPPLAEQQAHGIVRRYGSIDLDGDVADADFSHILADGFTFLDKTDHAFASVAKRCAAMDMDRDHALFAHAPW